MFRACFGVYVWLLLLYGVKRPLSAEQMLVLKKKKKKKAGQLPHCYRWAVRVPFAAAALTPHQQ